MDQVSSFFKTNTSYSLSTHIKNNYTPVEVHKKQATPIITKPTFSRLGFSIKGREFTSSNARNLMIDLFEEFSKADPSFLERFAARKHGTKRRFIAQNKYELYPDRPVLGETRSYQLSSGWWIGDNYGKESIEKIIRMACEVANLKFGQDVTIRLE
ncbi:MAG: hypothetical protein ACR2KB_00760 [Chitinophagaceae bacterium]